MHPPLGIQAHAVLPTVSSGYPPPVGRLPTCSSPVRHVSGPKATPFDLHALGTPPALILSQDQTLHQIFCNLRAAASPKTNHPPTGCSCLSDQLPGSPKGSSSPACHACLAPLSLPRRTRIGFASSSAHSSPCAHLLMCLSASRQENRPISEGRKMLARDTSLAVQFVRFERRRCRIFGYRFFSGGCVM